MTHFDDIVIGGGVAGTTVANGLAANKRRVAIIEERDWGGTTINRGSTPKKALLAIAETHHQLVRLQGNGFDTVPTINWRTAGNIRDQLIMDESTRTKTRLLANNVTTIEGHATVVDPHTISVQGTRYQADDLIIATGAKPRALTFPGSQYVGHSATLLRAHELPARIVILGAGIIAFALASIASEAGAQVTIIQHDKAALRAFDQPFVTKLMSQLKRQHVTFIFDAQVEQISKNDSTLNVKIVQADQTTDITTDACYNVTGRVPNIDGFGLEDLPVQTSTHGIHVSATLHSTVPSIWAVGDCNDASVPKLSAYAIYQGKYLVRQLTGVDHYPIDYPVPAMTVFSIPKLGQVGVATQTAEQNANTYTIQSIDAANWQTYARFNQRPTLLKLVRRRSDGHIVGMTVLGDQADILVNDFALLLNGQIDETALQRMIFAYPSMADDLYGLWQ